MILPHPETDLSTNLMVVGTDIVDLLNRRDRRGNFVLVEDIMNDFSRNHPKRTPDMFVYALTFLYAFGLIEYKGYKVKLTPISSETKQMTLFE